MAYNYTSFTEVDPNGHASVSSTEIEFEYANNESAYVYLDLTSINNFHFRFAAHCDDVASGSNAYLLTVSDDLGDHNTLWSGANDAISVGYGYTSTSGKAYIHFAALQNTASYLDEVDLGTEYYFDVKRVDDNCVLRVYSDSSYTTEVFNRTITGCSGKSYRYLIVASSNGSTGTAVTHGHMAALTGYKEVFPTVVTASCAYPQWQFLNLPTFTENDPSNVMTVGTFDALVSFTNSTAKHRLYKDYGAGALENWSYNFTANVISMGGNYKYVLVWSVSNDSDPGSGGYPTQPCGAFPYQQSASSHGWYLSCGGGDYLNSGGRSHGTPEYFTIAKSGTTVTLKRYADEARTNLTFTITGADTAGRKHRYLFVNRDYNYDYSGSYTATVSKVDDGRTLITFTDVVSVNPTVLSVSASVQTPTINITNTVVVTPDVLNCSVALPRYSYFDYTSFTEYDLANRLTVTSNGFTLTEGHLNERWRIYKDYNSNVIGNFHYLFDWKRTAQSGTFAYWMPFGLFDFADPNTSTFTSYRINLMHGDRLYTYVNGDLLWTNTPANNESTYWTVIKSSNTVTWYWYTDAARTNLKETRTQTDVSGQKYSQLFPCIEVYDAAHPTWYVSGQGGNLSYIDSDYVIVNNPATLAPSATLHAPTVVINNPGVTYEASVINATAAIVTPIPKVIINTTVIGLNGNDLTLIGTFTGTSKTSTGVSFTDAAATPRGYYYASQYSSRYTPNDAVKFRGHLDFTANGTGDYNFVFWALKNNATNAYIQFFAGLDDTTPAIMVNAANPTVTDHVIVSNPSQEIWYEIIIEASGYTFNVYSDAIRNTLLGTYYTDYPHTNPTWVLADNQNYGTRTFTGVHDEIEIVQYALVNAKALQPTNSLLVTTDVTTLDVIAETLASSPTVITSPDTLPVNTELCRACFPDTINVTCNVHAPTINTSGSITVTPNVVNVSTTNETSTPLVIAPAIYQPTYLPDYTLNDAGSNLTVTDYGVSGTAIRNAVSQLYHDFGANGVRDFTLTFKCSVSGNPNDGGIAPMLFANNTNNSYNQSQGLHCIRPSLMRTNSGQWYVHLVAPNVGTAVSQVISANTNYWVKVNRTGTTLTLDVYSDQGMQTQVGTQKTTTCQTENFRYFFPFNSYQDNVANVDFAFNFDDVRLITPVYVTATVETSVTSVTVTPDTLTATATVHAPSVGQNIVVTPDTLTATATVASPIIQISVSGHVNANTSVMSPTPHVAIQPDPVSVTVVVETPQARLIYQPGSLTIQTLVETPTPHVIYPPDPIDVRADLQRAVYPQVLPVVAELQPPIPQVIWNTTTLSALTAVLAPVVDIKEGKADWYYRMINTGGF
jgi:hypothetical protein